MAEPVSAAAAVLGSLVETGEFIYRLACDSAGELTVVQKEAAEFDLTKELTAINHVPFRIRLLYKTVRRHGAFKKESSVVGVTLEWDTAEIWTKDAKDKRIFRGYTISGVDVKGKASKIGDFCKVNVDAKMKGFVQELNYPGVGDPKPQLAEMRVTINCTEKKAAFTSDKAQEFKIYIYGDGSFQSELGKQGAVRKPPKALETMDGAIDRKGPNAALEGQNLHPRQEMKNQARAFVPDRKLVNAQNAALAKAKELRDKPLNWVIVTDKGENAKQRQTFFFLDSDGEHGDAWNDQIKNFMTDDKYSTRVGSGTLTIHGGRVRAGEVTISGCPASHQKQADWKTWLGGTAKKIIFAK